MTHFWLVMISYDIDNYILHGYAIGIVITCDNPPIVDACSNCSMACHILPPRSSGQLVRISQNDWSKILSPAAACRSNVQSVTGGCEAAENKRGAGVSWGETVASSVFHSWAVGLIMLIRSSIMGHISDAMTTLITVDTFPKTPPSQHH